MILYASLPIMSHSLDINASVAPQCLQKTVQGLSSLSTICPCCPYLSLLPSHDLQASHQEPFQVLNALGSLLLRGCLESSCLGLEQAPFSPHQLPASSLHSSLALLHCSCCRSRSSVGAKVGDRNSAFKVCRS